MAFEGNRKKMGYGEGKTFCAFPAASAKADSAYLVNQGVMLVECVKLGSHSGYVSVMRSLCDRS